jgi:hypothetical protein
MRINLANYLVVTGTLTLLVLTMPWLVVLGTFLLIIPGLILAMMPTAFMWGVIFAAGSWIVRSATTHEGVVFVGALALTALTVWAIPQPSFLQAKAALSQYRLQEVVPDKPVKLQGDILIAAKFARWDNANREKYGFRPWSCDNRCLALLFEAGVTSVTMDKLELVDFETLKSGRHVPGKGARTYRLVPRSQCGGYALKPDLDGRVGQFGKTMEDNKAIAAEWIARLATDVCLVSEPAISKYDMIMRMGSWRSSGTYKTRGSWSFPSGEASAEFSDIHDGQGQTLFRMYNLVTSALAVPFHISANGGLENFRFGWGTRLLPKGVSTEWEKPVKSIDDILDVRRTGDVRASTEAARRAVIALLSDASAPEEALQTAAKTWLGLMEKKRAAVEDEGLLKTLLADPRLTDLESAWILPKAFSKEVLRDIYPAIIEKLASWPANRSPKSSPLGQALKQWPDGFFTDADAATDALLDDTYRRRRAVGLIVRLSDRGAAAAPRLADMISFHLDAAQRYRNDRKAVPETEKYGGYPAHNSTAGAAVESLCLLGPAAAGELPKLRAIEQRFAKDGFVGRDWDRMMVRLGKPISEVAKPANLSGSEENYRRNLADWLARYKPDRSC